MAHRDRKTVVKISFLQEDVSGVLHRIISVSNTACVKINTCEIKVNRA